MTSIKTSTTAIAVALALSSGAELMAQRTLSEAAEQAHCELAKFIDSYGIIRDYVGETPTPEDCAEGRPNAIGWWSPIEDGPMFTGVYLVSACERAKRSGSQADKALASKLAAGLLKCASVSDVPGFIARGIAADGKSHYPLGSDDQTHPWFLGLHAYLESGIPSQEEKAAIAAKMLEVGNALEARNWDCPADGAFKGQCRGSYKGHMHRDVVRYVFMLRALYDASGDKIWLERYKKAMAEKPGKREKSRLEICASGYEIDREEFKSLESWAMWLYVGPQASLAWLSRNEGSPEFKAAFAQGLATNARSALAALPDSEKFDNADSKAFGESDWRKVFTTWFPQKTQADAERLSKIDVSKTGGRKDYEHRYMCQPLAAAAIVAMGGDGFGREAVEKALVHYDYSKIKLSRLFYAECAYYALPERESR